MAARPVVRLVFFLLLPLTVELQNANEHQCPTNTFTCGDSSCIPKDWVGDGEPDCDDGSDEKPNASATTVLLETTKDAGATLSGSHSPDVVTQATNGHEQPGQVDSLIDDSNVQPRISEEVLRRRFNLTGRQEIGLPQSVTQSASASSLSDFNGQLPTTGVFQSDRESTAQPSTSDGRSTVDSIESDVFESEPSETSPPTSGFNTPTVAAGILSEFHRTLAPVETNSLPNLESLLSNPQPTRSSTSAEQWTVTSDESAPAGTFDAHSTSDFSSDVQTASSIPPLFQRTSDSAPAIESTVFPATDTSDHAVDEITSQAPITLNITSSSSSSSSTGDYVDYEEDGPKASTGVVETVGCSAENRSLVEHCTTAISMWMTKLGQIDPNQPFFTEQTQNNWKLANEGCQLFPVFKKCLGNLYERPGDCMNSLTIAYWESLEAYTCQFLLPSAQEHRPCFEKLDNHPCQLAHPRIDTTQKTLDEVCNLVFSVKLQLDCIEQVVDQCEQPSREIVGPLLNETDMFDKHYFCSQNSPPTVAEAQPVTTASTSASAVCASVEAMAPCQPLIAPVLVSAQVNIFSLANESARLQKMCATFDQWKTCVGKVADADCWLDKGPLRMIAILSDIMCTPQMVEQMVVHKKCLASANADERVGECQAELDAANQQQNLTLCKALEAFNTFVDCSLPAVNDFCSLEAQDFVISIQAKLSDKEINNQCYEGDGGASVDSPSDTGFHLTPQHDRCGEEQENAALSCLVDLMALQGEFSKFANTNLFLELSNENSTLLNKVCSIYGKYEKCLQEKVFGKTNGVRCSFNAPLNTLARVGLSPVCDPEARQKLTANRPCLEKLSSKPAEFNQCAQQLYQIGPIMAHMLQGGENGEANLCQAYYLIRNMFGCLEPMVKLECGETQRADLMTVTQKITNLGVEEGCPAVRPDDFQKILQSTSAPTVSSTTAEIANNIEAPIVHAPVAAPVGKSQSTSGDSCPAEEQQKFADCVLPITKLQPHPLAVIKQPKQIELACSEFNKFIKCRQPINCRPLWAEGMVGMFTYACGDGNTDYLQVRQCVRKVTTRQDVRACVEEFSKGAPDQACMTSNALLQCAIPIISDKCDEKAVSFVRNYVTRFATAVDHSCIIADHGTGAPKPVTSVNCTAEESATIDTCGSPLESVSQDLADLFKGGLQSFIGNMNKLGPIFARGCNISNSFKSCARPVIEGSSSCQASSCLLKAGDGICNETDQAAAIDRHLNCVFALIGEPDFGKCLRETLATLKDFSLKGIKTMLPKFVDCVEPTVIQKCGATPINVLRAMGTTGFCILSFSDDVNGPFAEPHPEPIVPVVPVCTADIKSAQDQCVSQHLQRNSFMPIALLSNPDSVDRACSDVVNYKACMTAGRTAICEEKSSAALVAMLEFICREINLVEYKKHGSCLSNVSISEKGQKCVGMFLAASPEESCQMLGESAQCASHAVNEMCGEMALHLSYEAMNYFAKQLNKSCSLEVPSVTLNTGCSEDDLVAYLGCETHLDKFKLRPISIIRNASQFDDFCKAFNENYRPCIQAMTCHFEPVSTANTAVFDYLCNTPLKPAEYKKNGECLAAYMETSAGEKCAEAYHAIDFLSADATSKVCAAFDKTLTCAAPEIDQHCGLESVMLAYDIHTTWAHGFDPLCRLAPPDLPGNSSAVSQLAEPEPIGQPEPTGAPEPEPHASNNSIAVPEPGSTETPATDVTDLPLNDSFVAGPIGPPEPLPAEEPNLTSPEPEATGNPVPEPTGGQAEPEPAGTKAAEPELTTVLPLEKDHDVSAEPEPAASAEPAHNASAEPEPKTEPEPPHETTVAEPEPSAPTAEPIPATEPEKKPSSEPEPGASATENDTKSAQKSRISVVAIVFSPILVMALSRW